MTNFQAAKKSTLIFIVYFFVFIASPFTLATEATGTAEIIVPTQANQNTAIECVPSNSPNEGFFSQPKKYISIGIENYAPNGHVITSNQTRYDLSNFGKSLMPNVSIGLHSKAFRLDDFSVNYGISAQSGYTENNQLSHGKFTSSTLTVQPSMKVHWRSKEKIMTRIQAELGQQQMSYSGSAVQSFMKSAFYMGYSLGLEWAPHLETSSLLESMTPNQKVYSFYADYYERTGLTSDDNWVPYNGSLIVGISYYW
jgi:hypothetical protein